MIYPSKYMPITAIIEHYGLPVKSAFLLADVIMRVDTGQIEKLEASYMDEMRATFGKNIHAWRKHGKDFFDVLDEMRAAIRGFRGIPMEIVK